MLRIQLKFNAQLSQLALSFLQRRFFIGVRLLDRKGINNGWAQTAP